MEFLKKNFIFIIVFITGAAVLVIEVSATRILAPYFGNTLFTVSSIIGVILGALSLGYYFGGIVADKTPSFALFFFLILVAGVFSLFIQFLSKFFLPIFEYFFGIRSGPIISSLTLFFLPSLILGMISPFAIKLSAFQLEKIGNISGKIYFWSTLGSIAGSFLTGFFLIPHFGVSKIIFFTGLLLLLIGGIGFSLSKDKKLLLNAKNLKIFFFLFFILVLSFCSPFLPKSESIIFQKDGFYSQITVEEREIKGRKARVLRVDKSFDAAVFIDSDDLPFEYTKYYVLYKILNPKIKKVLFLGGGGYTVPRKILLENSEVEKVEVAEIEPLLYPLAKKYFKLFDDPRLINHLMDGRRFLKETKDNYDFIFADVYLSLYSIPIHFTTKEFFTLAKSKLSDNGIFMMNVIGKLHGKGNILLLSIFKTFQSVFENSYLFAVQSPEEKKIQNFIIVGLKNNQKIDFESKDIQNSQDEIIQNLKNHFVNPDSLNLNKAIILTDDFAPVEYLTAKIFD